MSRLDNRSREPDSHPTPHPLPHGPVISATGLQNNLAADASTESLMKWQRSPVEMKGMTA